MLKTIKSTVFILGFLVGFLGCQYVFDVIEIKKLKKSNIELKASSENWKTLYQLSNTKN